MDYRSSITDDEHPAGASPWGTSPPVSPRRNGSSYPYDAAAQDTSNGFAQDDPNASTLQRPDTASSAASTTDFNSSQQSEEQQPAEESHHQQHPHTQPKPQGQDQQQYTRRPAGPQYKMQAKITGLERTGRKDPILRFDVHVGAGNIQRLYCSQY